MNIGDFSPDYAIFYEFLLANNALDAFLKNSNNSSRVTSNVIDSCIRWAATSQGATYWQRLSNDRPRISISGNLFRQYCELLEQASLSRPYEFW